MLRAAASLLFYSRFFSRFSTRGLERRMREWRPYSERLDGQTWLVTGASGGIGRAIALAANARGASVLAVARDADKLATLRAAAHEPARLQPLAFDLSLVRQTRRLADAVAARGQPLAVLVNNVGVLLNTFTRTTEGLEASLATNLLNHVVLTEALHDGGALDPRGVVVNMSSGGMYGARLDFDTLLRDSAEGYDGMAAYAQHKRAQVELTRAWNGNWGGRPAVHVMHPGWVDTDGVRSALPAFRATLRRFLRDADQGADTALWLGATRPRAPREGGIWLDRVLDAEHEFGFTRNSAVAPAALLKRLRGIADAI